jgi:hypothetical protein
MPVAQSRLEGMGIVANDPLTRKYGAPTVC